MRSLQIERPTNLTSHLNNDLFSNWYTLTLVIWMAIRKTISCCAAAAIHQMITSKSVLDFCLDF